MPISAYGIVRAGHPFVTDTVVPGFVDVGGTVFFVDRD